MTVGEFLRRHVDAGHAVEISRHDLEARLGASDWDVQTTTTLQPPESGLTLGGDRRLRRITVQEHEHITLKRPTTTGTKPICHVEMKRRFLFMPP